jgi:hypothetical protein
MTESTAAYCDLTKKMLEFFSKLAPKSYLIWQVLGTLGRLCLQTQAKNMVKLKK